MFYKFVNRGANLQAAPHVGMPGNVFAAPQLPAHPLRYDNEMQVFGVFDKLLSYSERAESARRLGEEIN